MCDLQGDKWFLESDLVLAKVNCDAEEKLPQQVVGGLLGHVCAGDGMRAPRVGIRRSVGRKVGRGA